MTTDIRNLAAYAESCRQIAARHLAGLSLAQVADLEADYNAYPNPDKLSPPRDVLVLEDLATNEVLATARQAVLDGLIFWEHLAAGEATRLGLGSKYLIYPHQVAQLPRLQPLESSPVDQSSTTLPLTLGDRHLWQWSFEISRLAEDHGLDPATVLSRQKVLLVINEQNQAEIIRRVTKANFMGLNRENFFFLVQSTFPGLVPGPTGWQFDPNTPQRLHNHGQLALQKNMDDQIFHLAENGSKHFLSRDDYLARLNDAADLVSYSIEDLDYLSQALDFEALGTALALGQQGFEMTMEIVANNPLNPVKGGLCAFEASLGRNVVVESLRLPNCPPSQISHLNRNFNHYPNPIRALEALDRDGLFMPICVKDGGLYFQPAQGDLNFLVKTAFITRRSTQVLHSLKTPADRDEALLAMARQDTQAGIMRFFDRVSR